MLKAPRAASSQHYSVYIAPATARLIAGSWRTLIVSNPKLFRSPVPATPVTPATVVAANVPAADTVNPAGGAAFSYGPQHRLAQLLMTGTAFDTYYQGGDAQLAGLVEAAQQVNDAEFLAKAVVAGATTGFMKDLPLAGLVLLSRQDKQGDLFRAAFNKVIWDGRRLRTCFQLIRSKQLGRTSLSYRWARAFVRWLNNASASKLINAAIGGKGADGKDASLEDVIACSHPKPPSNARRALYGWLRKRSPEQWSKGEHTATLSDLPEEARLVRAFDAASTVEEQLQLLRTMQERRFSIRWDRLSGNAKGDEVWREFARMMAPMALRMNLNALSDHGVFQDPDLTAHVIARLTDAVEIQNGRQWPFQYFGAYKHLKETVPQSVRSALHTAAELCCGNVPRFPGPVAICVDVSSSMCCPVTGYQTRGKQSKVTCVDAAAVFASALFRANPDSVVIPFNDRAILPDEGRPEQAFDPGDSMLSLASRLAALCCGGTDCHRALEAVNVRYGQRPFAAVVYLSDNASWVTASQETVDYWWRAKLTSALMVEWRRFQENQRHIGRFPQPKLICWDLASYGSTQAPEEEQVYNVGGFADAVFGLIAALVADDRMRFVRMVEETQVL